MANRLYRPAWPWVACVTIALLWPASQLWAGWAACGVGNRRGIAEIGPGWFCFTTDLIRTPNRTILCPQAGSAPMVRLCWLTAADRLRMGNPRVYSSPGDYHFYCPLWVVTVAAGLFVAGLMLSRARRATAAPPGHCRRCGYDLRATPTRCPECGSTA